MDMIFFLVAFSAICLTLGVGYLIFIVALYIVYKVTGGKRSFRSWFRAMQF